MVVPCLNEAGTIRQLLDSLRRQTCPADQLEIIVVDGRSIDGTRRVVEEFAKLNPGLALRVIDNPGKSIPRALNLGLAEAKGAFVVRLDGHSTPQPDYVDRCLAALIRTGAANVGGIWEILPSAETWIARSIAVAGAHPLGAGDARYRIGGPEGEVDTVPFGAFRREWLDRVGQFNELLLSNEDYEYNLRLRQAGGVVWFDPKIRSGYLAKPDLRSLALQYWRYGYWKGRMLRMNLASLRWRQALPALFVLVLCMLLFSSLLLRLASAAPLGVVATYLIVVLVAGAIQAARRRDPSLLFGFPVAISAMHFSWGTAFWIGMAGLASRGPTHDPRA